MGQLAAYMSHLWTLYFIAMVISYDITCWKWSLIHLLCFTNTHCGIDLWCSLFSTCKCLSELHVWPCVTNRLWSLPMVRMKHGKKGIQIWWFVLDGGVRPKSENPYLCLEVILAKKVPIFSIILPKSDPFSRSL